MDYVFLKDFFTLCSLPTLIVALIVAIVFYVLRLTLSKRLPFVNNNYCVIALAMALYLIYDAFFVCANPCFRVETLSLGLLSGSLSLVALTLIKKISLGQLPDASVTVILIRSLINGFICEDLELTTAQNIDNLIFNSDTTETDTITEKLSALLKENSVTVLSDIEYRTVSKIILKAVKALKG